MAHLERIGSDEGKQVQCDNNDQKTTTRADRARETSKDSSGGVGTCRSCRYFLRRKPVPAEVVKYDQEGEEQRRYNSLGAQKFHSCHGHEQQKGDGEGITQSGPQFKQCSWPTH